MLSIKNQIKYSTEQSTAKQIETAYQQTYETTEYILESPTSANKSKEVAGTVD